MNVEDPEYWKEVITNPIKNNPQFWTRELEINFVTNPLNLMALHGFLCLALRHPGTRDHSCRSAIVQVVKQIGKTLVELGALSPEQLTQIEKIEAEATS
ncbi:MAG TPA: hypothetical protein VN368_02920 [Candidatus Methylomirabilis sp.]|nr:hypothetical protein [Candidatus Methylomirabilis sp.]